MVFATLLNSRKLWDAAVLIGIEELFQDYSDEKKADLYALVTENVHLGMTYAEMVHTVNWALTKNEERFGDGRH
jgi:hypothetical protein